MTAARFDEPYTRIGDDANTSARKRLFRTPSFPFAPAQRPVKRRAELDASMRSPRRSFARAGFRKTIPFSDALPHCLRHARHALRCLAGVMIHLCGSRSTRRPIVSFHFIPTGVRFLHVSGGRERGSPLRLSASRFDPSGQRSFWQARWGENGSWRVLLLASFISCGWLPNTIAQTNLCRCGTSVTLARSICVVPAP